MTMHSYLTTVTPDYATTTLSIKPHGDLSEEGGRKVSMQEMDDGKKEAIMLGGATSFRVPIEWLKLSETNSATIMDFWLDTAKGAFGSRTFKWLHPTDGYTYVVRFDSSTPPKRTLRENRYDVKNATLIVEGNA